MDKSDVRRTSIRITESGAKLEVPLANGNVVKFPVSDLPEINISEEVNRSGVWKSLEGSNTSLESETQKSSV